MRFFNNFIHKANFFVKTSLIGGILFLAPLTILFFIFDWIFGIISNWIQPITNFFIQFIYLPEFIVDIFVISLIVFICFVIGIILNTTLGKFFHNLLSKQLTRIPGYKTIRDVIEQFIGNDKDKAFSNAILIKAFGEDNILLGLINGEYILHEKKYYVVFVPTSPNPTSGFPIHVPEENVVEFLNCSVEEAMKVIIGCGSGMNKIIKKP